MGRNSIRIGRRNHPKNGAWISRNAAEAVKSNRVDTVFEGLGIGSECWDRRWSEQWKKHNSGSCLGLRQGIGTARINGRNFGVGLIRNILHVSTTSSQIRLIGRVAESSGRAWLAMVISEQAAKKDTTDRAKEVVLGGGESTRARQPAQAPQKSDPPPTPAR